MKSKIKILMLLAILSFKSYGQDSSFIKKDSLRTKVFCFTPNNNVDNVNGLTIGAGLTFLPNEDNGSIKKVNGMNIEINPISPFILLMADPNRIFLGNKSSVVVNGLSISTGNFYEACKFNGLVISAFTVHNENNGISISGVYNFSGYSNGIQIAGFGNGTEVLNGIQISGIGNSADKMNGLQISFFNHADTFNGIQLGVLNKSTNFTGIQIGVFNKTDKNKGLQIGFWNINNKRSIPFLNW